MDSSQSTPENGNYWINLADAVTRVENLGTCEYFKQLVDAKAIRHKFSWTQDPDDTLLLEVGCSLIDQVVGQNGGYHTIKDASSAILTSDTGDTATEISINIDGQDVIIRSRLGNIYVANISRDLPVVTSNYCEISDVFLRIMASNPELIRTDDLGVAMNEIEHAVTDSDAVAKTLKHLGNLSGTSSETTWSIFTDAETDDAIVVRLTETETPDDSVVATQLQRYESSELFAEESGIDTETHMKPEENIGNENFATTKLADSPNSIAFIGKALKRSSIEDMGSPLFSDRSNSDDARHYAELCQDFLRLYDYLADVA